MKFAMAVRETLRYIVQHTAMRIETFLIVSQVIAIVAGVLAYLTCGLFGVCVFCADGGAAQFMLSSVSQGVAAMMGIILTVTLIHIQSSYGRVATWFFMSRKSVIMLMTCYASAIIMSLYLMGIVDSLAPAEEIPVPLRAALSGVILYTGGIVVATIFYIIFVWMLNIVVIGVDYIKRFVTELNKGNIEAAHDKFSDLTHLIASAMEDTRYVDQALDLIRVLAFSLSFVRNRDSFREFLRLFFVPYLDYNVLSRLPQIYLDYQLDSIKTLVTRLIMLSRHMKSLEAYDAALMIFELTVARHIDTGLVFETEAFERFSTDVTSAIARVLQDLKDKQDDVIEEFVWTLSKILRRIAWFARGNVLQLSEAMYVFTYPLRILALSNKRSKRVVLHVARISEASRKVYEDLIDICERVVHMVQTARTLPLALEREESLSLLADAIASAIFFAYEYYVSNRKNSPSIRVFYKYFTLSLDRVLAERRLSIEVTFRGRTPRYMTMFLRGRKSSLKIAQRRVLRDEVPAVRKFFSELLRYKTIASVLKAGL